MILLGKIVPSFGRRAAVVTKLRRDIHMKSPKVDLGNVSEPWFGAIDQGTTFTRFLVFDHEACIVASARRPITLKSPRPGWVEQDPFELIESVKEVINEVHATVLRERGVRLCEKLVAIGLTNQRETTIAWDSDTSMPYGPAIVWMDTRNQDDIAQTISQDAQKALHKRITGLPPSTYFSAGKIKWIIENQSTDSSSSFLDRVKFGTVDSWILWNLLEEKRHVSDVTNASRTALMDIEKLQWSREMSQLYQVRLENLAEIKPSVSLFGKLGCTAIAGMPITAVLGDQHAALLGQDCLRKGELKDTFGTGCFILCNTGHNIIKSDLGLVTTIAFQLGAGEKPHYALEAPVACGGSTLEWLSGQIGLLEEPKQIDSLASTTSDGVMFIPSLAGTLAPRWTADSRGAFLGLSLYSKKEHLLRAVMESIVFSNKEVIDLIHKELGFNEKRRSLIVDGGLTNSDLLMQLQADSLQMCISRPAVKEATAFGAAKAAAIGAGFLDWPQSFTAEGTIFTPCGEAKELNAAYQRWKRAADMIGSMRGGGD